jgi:hypothetical protein
MNLLSSFSKSFTAQQLSWVQLSFLIGFGTLDVLLYRRCKDSIPQRDVIEFGVFLSFAAVSAYLFRGNHRQELQKTNLFHLLFALLASLEILAIVIAPWLVILGRGGSGPSSSSCNMLAPHLFIFQAQIGAEALVMSKSSAALFWYTCFANAYRSVTLVASIRRVVRDGVYYHHVTLTHVLLVIAVVLWICSNLFIVLIWYPLLPVAMPRAIKKKRS